MIFLLGLLFGVDAPCPEGISINAFKGDGNTEKKTADTTRVDVFSGLGCVDDILSPSDAIWLHGVKAKALMEVGDASGVTLSVLAARSIPLPGPMPAWLEAPLGALPVPAPWSPVSLPDGVALFVDGTPARARPLDRPAVYQAVGSGGVVLWTKYLSGEEELPAGFKLMPPVSRAVLPAEEIIGLKELLLAGRYEEVLLESVSLSAQHPEHAETFRSIAAIARDQQNLMVQGEQQAPEYRYRIRDKTKRWPYRTDTRKGILVGFELGTPTALRVDWKFAGQVVDSLGLRVGVGVHWDYLSTMGDSIIADLVIVDFNLATNWQLETSLGLTTVNSSVMPSLGVAAQWDPSTPLQVSIGASVDPYGIAPRAAVGFMW